MLVVASIGNTTIRLGAFEDRDEPVFVKRVPIENLADLEAPGGDVEAVAVASVNAAAEAQFAAWTRANLGKEPLALRSDIPVPMPLACEGAERVGPDRLANAIALHRRTGRGGIAVDFGTAIDLVVVSSAGEFLGGAIAPGLAMSARALHNETALLPLVNPAEHRLGLTGRTKEAIATGLVWGLAGLADRLIERFAWPGAPVIATGGDAGLLVRHCQRVKKVAPNLTLEGLREAYLCWRSGRDRL